jgi:hypothetical protein
MVKKKTFPQDAQKVRLSHPPRRAKTRHSAGKAAADESTGGVPF